MTRCGQSLHSFFCGLFAVLAGIFSVTVTALACTTMALGPTHQTLIAYSYDQRTTGVGVAMVNPVGAIRSSLYDPPRATWRARFGSVTFNQAGQGMPTAGMNSAGLVVTLMWHDEGTYEAEDDRPRVNELEFIQFLLDRAGSVDEALAFADEVRVDGMIPIHFFLADAEGATATLAFDTGRTVVRQGDALPVRALTNASYATLIDGVGEFEPFGGDRSLPSSSNRAPTALDDSLVRFAHAALAIGDGATPVTTASAFAALDTVRTASTRWQIVFDPARRSISYGTTASPHQGTIQLTNLDFACRSRPLAIDIKAEVNQAFAGELRPLTEPQNRTIVRETFGSFAQFDLFGPEFPAIVSAAQMETMSCTTR
ncbi:MAG: carcinine hydrolase/isopenicillin-N N-acyltransferase family protein [Pseudomonadota bacterium]